MKIFNDFVKRFTDCMIPDVHQSGKRFYQADADLLKLIKISSRNINRDPEHAGLLLGEMKGKNFKPAFPLLDILNTMTDCKAVIDDKAEWLFLCGRDVFAKSVVSSTVDSGLVLVTNRKDEVLGYGSFQKKDNIAIKNILDRGDFLRREMSRNRR